MRNSFGILGWSLPPCREQESEREGDVNRNSAGITRAGEVTTGKGRRYFWYAIVCSVAVVKFRKSAFIWYIAIYHYRQAYNVSFQIFRGGIQSLPHRLHRISKWLYRTKKWRVDLESNVLVHIYYPTLQSGVCLLTMFVGTTTKSEAQAHLITRKQIRKN
jgi:hypothetical protein